MSWLPSDPDQAGAELSPPKHCTSTQMSDIDALFKRLAALKDEPIGSDEWTANDSNHRPISPTAALFGQLDKLPSAPSKSPGGSPSTGEGKDYRDANPEASSESFHRASSCPVTSDRDPPEDVGPSSLSSPKSFDSYTWSCASANLPNPLTIFGKQFHIPPLKETFCVSDDRFYEGEHWEKREKVGEGAFGQCYVAQELNEGSKTPLSCVKVCNKHYENEYDEVLALTLGSKANITEIVGFYGATVTPTGGRSNKVHVFMELMLDGSVEQLLKTRIKQFPDARPVLEQHYASVYLKDVLKALEFLHGQGMVHNDVKGANVLLDENGLNAKLADFGSATRLGADFKPNYDIWAAGCFLIEMLEGKRPAQIAQAKGDAVFSGEFPTCAGEKEEILSQCFSRKCTAAQIILCFQE